MPCDARRLRAVRFSLVARSSSWVPGFNLGHSGGDGAGSLEDEDPYPAIGAPGDAFLRRIMTTTVQLRNYY